MPQHGDSDSRSAVDILIASDRVPANARPDLLTEDDIWALLEGWDVPRVPPDVGNRESLESLAEVSGVSSVLRILEEIDPDAASRVDRRNPRRRTVINLHRSGAPSRCYCLHCWHWCRLV